MTTEAMLALVGSNVLKHRMRLGYETSYQMGKGLKLDPITLENIEKGKHASNLKSLHQIAQALNIDTWELLHPAPEVIRALTEITDLSKLGATKAKEKQNALRHHGSSRTKRNTGSSQ